VNVPEHSKHSENSEALEDTQRLKGPQSGEGPTAARARNKDELHDGQSHDREVKDVKSLREILQEPQAYHLHACAS
jgi:hypothetical protein